MLYKHRCRGGRGGRIHFGTTARFRAPREGHGQVTLHTNSWTQKNYMKGDIKIDIETDIATTRKNRPKGRFFENIRKIYLGKSRNN